LLVQQCLKFLRLLANVFIKLVLKQEYSHFDCLLERRVKFFILDCDIDLVHFLNDLPKVVCFLVWCSFAKKNGQQGQTLK